MTITFRTYTVSYTRTIRSAGDGQFHTTELTMTFQAANADDAVQQWHTRYDNTPDAQLIGAWQGGEWP